MKNSPDREMLIDELFKFSDMELCTALVYAKNLSSYGVDVANAWITAVQQSYALNQAYEKGRADERKHIMSMKENYNG